MHRCALVWVLVVSETKLLYMESKSCQGNRQQAGEWIKETISVSNKWHQTMGSMGMSEIGMGCLLKSRRQGVPMGRSLLS